MLDIGIIVSMNWKLSLFLVYTKHCHVKTCPVVVLLATALCSFVVVVVALLLLLLLLLLCMCGYMCMYLLLSHHVTNTYNGGYLFQIQECPN